MKDTHLEAATKLAAALILRDGRLTGTEILALPFVGSDDDAEAVYRRLAERFSVNVTRTGTRTTEVVLMRSPVARRGAARERIASSHNR